MNSKFKVGEGRAKELGLWRMIHSISNFPYYHADDIHHLLGEGMEVFGPTNAGKDFWGPDIVGITNQPDKYKALIIGISPIVQESEERRLLWEIVHACDRKSYQSESGQKDFNEALAKTRTFLEAKPDEEKKYRETGV